MYIAEPYDNVFCKIKSTRETSALMSYSVTTYHNCLLHAKREKCGVIENSREVRRRKRSINKTTRDDVGEQCTRKILKQESQI
ncbi:hypothetical protein PUN28_008593 [Cardiocondyla obscurior]|uniref:Uncharacterized protein n=1 Tax=Cardiocondyla obscurior TaxID=286306 RepID=A0AAW2G3H6_9HYME